MPRTDVILPYILTFEHRPHYLFATVQGDHDNYMISTLYWEEISLEIRRTDYKKLLVYEELKTNASRSDAFQAACSFRKEDFPGVRIAFVDRYNEHSPVNDLALQALRNKGLELENFSRIEDAEQWLVPYCFAA